MKPGESRMDEFCRLLDELDGNDFWELANNEGSEMASALSGAIRLLRGVPDKAVDIEWIKARATLLAWAESPTGYADEDQDA